MEDFLELKTELLEGRTTSSSSEAWSLRQSTILSLTFVNHRYRTSVVFFQTDFDTSTPLLENVDGQCGLFWCLVRCFRLINSPCNYLCGCQRKITDVDHSRLSFSHLLLSIFGQPTRETPDKNIKRS